MIGRRLAALAAVAGLIGALAIVLPAAEPERSSQDLSLDRPPERIAARWVGITEVPGRPTGIGFDTGRSRLWIGTKEGIVYVVSTDSRSAGPAQLALDLTGVVSTSNDQGLLNLILAPGGDELYVLYVDHADDLVLRGFDLGADGSPVLPGRRLLTVPMASKYHQGGGMAWERGGTLLLGIGDNGSSMESQSGRSLVGKILRIVPTPGDEDPYRVPADNPFVGVVGIQPEIWAFGVRNPWRIAVDEHDQEVWIADVGDQRFEEVDEVPLDSSGADLGWPFLEGDAPGPVFERTNLPLLKRNGDRIVANQPLLAPTLSLRHGEGTCAIIGGAPYRGAIAELRGRYVFADFCDTALRAVGSDGVAFRWEADAPLPSTVYAVEQSPNDDLFVLLLSGEVLELEPQGVEPGS